MYKLLIVDDNTTDCNGLMDIINWNSIGFNEIEIATDGVEGYNKAKEFKPDLILTDISMPNMDGIEMTEKIKLLLPNTKFIFMSCFEDFEYAKSALEYQVVGYVLKPIDVQELLETVIKAKNSKEDEMKKELIEYNLKQQIKENIPLMREHFILDLFYGRITKQEDVLKKAEYLHMPVGEQICVILACAENIGDIINQSNVDETYLLNFNINNELQSWLFGKWTGYSILYESVGVAALIYAKRTEFGLLLEDIEVCQRKMSDSMGQNIIISISNIKDDFELVPTMLKNVERAMNLNIFNKKNSGIILADEMEAFESYSYDIQKIHNEINNLLNNTDAAKVQEFINNYYNDTIIYSETNIKVLTSAIINSINIFLLEQNESFATVFDDGMIIWKKLMNFTTIIDIKQWVYNLILTIAEYMNAEDNKRYNKIICDIKAVIDLNYQKISNAEQIVSSLYISAGYANKVFKKYTGKTMFDYLTDKRMAEAKKLLEDPYCKIYEVAESVGYGNNTYFTSVFKQHFNMTPKEYRSKNSKGGT